MPIFRLNSKLAYFCHVPKCGGTAVEHYLQLRFGPLAFLDSAYKTIRDPWSRTSPQHIAADDLARFFPAGFFDASFAVVRHPVPRMISEYHFRRDREKTIPADLSFSDWLSGMPGLYTASRWALDNHLRPMCEMVPSGSTVFELEDGLDHVVSYLDGLAGEAGGARSISPLQQRLPGIVPAIPSPADIEIIERLYSRDFDRFGYQRQLA